MDYFTLQASKPGAPAPKTEKRTADSKIIQIDCSSLLAGHEIIFGEPKVTSPTLNIPKVETKLGKFIRFRVEGGPTDIPHMDYLVSFMVQTSTGNELSVPVTIRAYSV